LADRSSPFYNLAPKMRRSNPANGSWRIVQVLSTTATQNETFESRQRQLADRSSSFYTQDEKRFESRQRQLADRSSPFYNRYPKKGF